MKLLIYSVLVLGITTSAWAQELVFDPTTKTCRPRNSSDDFNVRPCVDEISNSGCRPFQVSELPGEIRLDNQMNKVSACYEKTRNVVEGFYNSAAQRITICDQVTTEAKAAVTGAQYAKIKGLETLKASGGLAAKTAIDDGIAAIEVSDAILAVAEFRCAACESNNLEECSEAKKTADRAQIGNYLTGSALTKSNGIARPRAARPGKEQQICNVNGRRAISDLNKVAIEMSDPTTGLPVRDESAYPATEALMRQCREDFQKYSSVINGLRLQNQQMKLSFQTTRQQLTTAALAVGGGAALIVGTKAIVDHNNKDDSKDEKIKTASNDDDKENKDGQKKDEALTEEEKNRKRGYVKVDGKYVNCMTPDNYDSKPCLGVMVSLCQGREFGVRQACKSFNGYYCGTTAVTKNSNFCLIQTAAQYCSQNLSTITDSPGCAWGRERPESCLDDPENVQCLISMTASQLAFKCRNFTLDPICTISQNRVVTQPEGRSDFASVERDPGGMVTANSVSGGGMADMIGGAKTPSAADLFVGTSRELESLQKSGTLR